MPPIIHDVEQGSNAWIECRLGIPTASKFKDILAKGRGGAESKTRTGYMINLASERISGEPCDTYYGNHMARGHRMEPMARAEYEWKYDIDVELVGFVTNDFGFGEIGYRPDCFIGERGLGEIKSRLPLILAEVVKRNAIPPGDWAQVQGGLWAAEKEWLDYIVWWPGLPLFVKRTGRDTKYIRVLSDAVECFMGELDELEYKMRNR